jgi:hypothetical protein
MAAALSISTSLVRRPISIRKIEANRRNAKRSTGPRTIAGKARVSCNAVKHGFFAGVERWTEDDRRALDAILEGLRDEFKPTEAAEKYWVATLATTTVRLAMMMRYENLAALSHHLKRERELNERIAIAEPAEARSLEARRDALKAAGLWRPMLPDDRTMGAILRYQGSLDRARNHAYSTLMSLQDAKRAENASFGVCEIAKTNPPKDIVEQRPEAAQARQAPPTSIMKIAKTNPPQANFDPASMVAKTQKQTHRWKSPHSSCENRAR